MKLYLIIISSLLFISCNSQAPKTTNDSFENGTLQGNIFYNKYFEFKLEIDTPWHILNRSELTHLINERADILKEKTDKDISISKSADILLSLTIDTIETMPHVLFSSLDISMFPQIKNENDYLNDYFSQVKQMYKNYNIQITSSEIGQEKIGKKTFFTTLITIKAENFLAYQKRYSLKIKNKLLNLMTNYDSDGHSKECLNLLNNIRWE